MNTANNSTGPIRLSTNAIKPPAKLATGELYIILESNPGFNARLDYQVDRANAIIGKASPYQTNRKASCVLRERFDWLVSRPKLELVGERFGALNSG